NGFEQSPEVAALNDWEIIVNKMIKAGFSVGWVSAFDNDGRTVWIVDAHREGERIVNATGLRADHRNQNHSETAGSALKRPASSLCSKEGSGNRLRAEPRVLPLK